jgi:hypothetical protein
MEINDQLSKYQAEYYTENLHDAFINVQRLLNNYNTKINCLEDAISEELTYRKQSKKQRMKKFGARFLGFIGFLFILLTIALLGVAGYVGYNLYLDNAYVFYGFNGLYVAIAAFVAFVIAFILTCKIYKRRSVVGRRLKVKKARKALKAKKKVADELSRVMTLYPMFYEQMNKVLVRTKRHPLGKIIIDAEDKTAIDNVKGFCANSEEAVKRYQIKEEN